MGLRLYSIYKNFDDSATYTLQIYDNNYAGASKSFDIVDGDVVLRFEGSQQDPFQWIVPTVLDFTMLVSTQDHQDFVDTLVISNEGRFWCRLLKGADVAFIGLLTADNSWIDATSLTVKKKFSLTAIDGLSMLKSIPYAAAEEQNYLLQEQPGKFRAITANPVVEQASFTDYNPWTVETEDYGDNFNTTTGVYTFVGRVDFDIYVRILADCTDYITANGLDTAFLNRNGDDGFLMTMELWKYDGATRTSLATKDLRFKMKDESGLAVTNAVVAETIRLDDVVLDGEDVHCTFTFDQDTNSSSPSYGSPIIEFTFDTVCYWQNKVDSSITVKPVYGSVLNHLRHILTLLPTHQYYASGVEFFSTYITHVEQGQGVARGENYIGIPYNVFVKDYSSSPPTVDSCWEALEKICMLFPGQLVYRSGVYQLSPWHYATAVNQYDKDFDYITFANKTFSEYPLTCLGKGQYTYLPPVRHVELCFQKVTTSNLLSAVTGKYPSLDPDAITTTGSIIMEERPYRLRFIIRAGRALAGRIALGLGFNNSAARHEWKGYIKIGSKYLDIENINAFKQSSAIYSLPEYNTDSASRIDIHGPMQPDVQDPLGLFIDVPEHLIDVSYDLPPQAYTGPIEFNLKYSKTYFIDGPEGYIEKTMTFNWSLESVRLSTLDAVDEYGLYTDEICTRVYRNKNSKTYEMKVPYSDLAELDEDPAGIRVLQGGQWVRPESNGWSGRSLQAAMTQWMANRMVKPAELHTGRYRTNTYHLGHIRPTATQYMLMMTGTYSTKMMELEGTWIKYESSTLYNALNLITFLKSVDTKGDNAERINQISGRSGGNGDSTPAGESETRELYEYYTTGETGTTIQLPANVRLPDPDDYTPAQLMRMFDGSKRGSGNYVYRTTPSRPEHFSIDVDNNRINLYRASTSDIEHFFMWEIL